MIIICDSADLKVHPTALRRGDTFENNNQYFLVANDGKCVNLCYGHLFNLDSFGSAVRVFKVDLKLVKVI